MYIKKNKIKLNCNCWCLGIFVVGYQIATRVQVYVPVSFALGWGTPQITMSRDMIFTLNLPHSGEGSFFRKAD